MACDNTIPCYTLKNNFAGPQFPPGQPRERPVRQQRKPRPGSTAISAPVKMLDGKAPMHYIRRRRLAVAT